jgi:hypothetical protein
VLESRHVDAVLVPAGSPVARALRRAQPAWHVAHSDARSTLLLAAPPAAIDAERALPGPDLHLSRGSLALVRGDLALARQELELAQRGDPLLFASYIELMFVAARAGEAPSVRRWIDAALDQDARWSDRVWLAAADAYAKLGDAAAERDALRRVALQGPFDDDRLRASVRARAER